MSWRKTADFPFASRAKERILGSLKLPKEIVPLEPVRVSDI